MDNNSHGVLSKGIFSGGTLKIIAIVSMLIDHTAAVLVEPGTTQYNIMRSYIGRLAFPIFCFLLVEGFIHTKDIRKYALRLGIFALVSEIPFNLAFMGDAYDTYHQNVFFTLFIGLLVLIGIKAFDKYKVVCIGIIIVGCLLAKYLKTDYNYMGVLMILCFYYFRDNIATLFVGILPLNMILGQSIAVLTLIPIRLYNGKRGLSLKYVFYIFYPLHLYILYLIKLYA